MKFCLCGAIIPVKIKIDGRWRNLQRRVKCLICSPFGTASTLPNPNTKYSDDLLKVTVATSHNMADVVTKLGTNISGNMYQHIASRISRLGLNTSHWIVGNSGLTHRGGSKRKTSAEILKVYKSGESLPNSGQARRALVEIGKPYRCTECHRPPMWEQKPLVLQIDHRDGNRRNWEEKNLRFLCPNCHSQTENFGSRKHAKGSKKNCRNGIHFIKMISGSDRN